MAIKSRNDIKIYFETGDIPTESQFWDFIDSYFHKEDDSITLYEYNGNKRLGIGINSPGSRLGLLAEGTGKHVLSFHTNLADIYGSWLLSMNQGNTSGFSISEGSHLSSINRFFIKPLNGYVGIGTNTPGEQLEINGAIKIGDASSNTASVGTIRYNAGTGDLEGRVNTGSGDEWKSLTASDGGGGTPSQWTTNGSDIYYASGNVGVGITPTETLDVNGGLRIRNAGAPAAVAGTIKFDGSDLLVYIGGSWKSLTAQGQWSGNAGNNIYISTGNVGIGVTSGITERLEISGAIKIGDSANADSAEGTIIYESGTFKGKTIDGWQVLANTVNSVNGQTGDVTIPSGQWSTSGSNIYYNSSGKVGIGSNTATPAEKLDVEGAIKIGTTTNTNVGTIRYTGSAFEGRVGGAWKQLNNAVDSVNGQTGDVTIALSQWSGTSGADIYVISGNVGIGLSSPTQKLHLSELKTDDVLGVNLENEAANQNDLWTIGHNANIGTPSLDGRLSFIETTGSTPSERLTIKPGGSVGIGVNNPTEKLELSGAIKISDASVEAAAIGTIRYNSTAKNFEGRIDDGAGNGLWKTLNNQVNSVNGQTGTITLNTSQISEVTNLYYTDIRAKAAAIIAPITGYTSGAGTVSASDTILQAIQKLNGNIVGLTTTSIAEGSKLFYTDARSIAAPLTGYTSGAGTVSASDTVLQAIQKLNGNIVGLTTTSIAEGSKLFYTDARSIAAPLTGYTSGAGTVSASDTVLQAIQKLNGNIAGLSTTNITEGTKLFYTDTRAKSAAIAAQLTGYVSGAGTISATDTILQAIQKLNGNTASFTSSQWSGSIGGDIYITTGNVGLGLSSPTQKLHLSELKTDDVLGVNIENEAATQNDLWTIGHNANTGTAALDGRLSFIETSGSTPSERLTIKPGGSVGIGVNNPTEKLELSGAIKISDASVEAAAIGTIRYNSTAKNFEGRIDDGAGNGLWKTLNNQVNSVNGQSGDVIVTASQWTTNGSNVYYNSSGKVGIGSGTGTPAEKLDVEGAIKIGTTTGTNAGTIRYTGSAFEGRVGSNWKQLNNAVDSVNGQTGAVTVAATQWSGTIGSDLTYTSGNVIVNTLKLSSDVVLTSFNYDPPGSAPAYNVFQLSLDNNGSSEKITLYKEATLTTADTTDFSSIPGVDPSFATALENMRIRIGELEARLQSFGLI